MEDRFVELAGVVAAHERDLGHDHPETLAARHELALSYYHFALDNSDERLDDAVRTMESAADGRIRVLGEAHPDTLRTLESLSWLYNAAGATGQQDLGQRIVAGWEQVVAQRERELGPDEPDTQFARLQLAAACRGVGRNHDSQRLDEQVNASWGQLAAERAQRLGPIHPDTVTAREHHAYSHRWLGRGDDEVALVEEIAADHERLLGPADPRTLHAQVQLASRYYEGGYDVAQAVALSERIIDKVDGEDLRTVRAVLVLAYHGTGRADDAEAICARYPFPDDED